MDLTQRRLRLERDVADLEEIVKTDPVCMPQLKARRTMLERCKAKIAEAEGQPAGAE